MSTRPNSSEAIRALDLGKVYPGGVTGLAGLTLTIDHGEFVGVLGPSGSGKTTLLRLCNASIRPTSGDLEVLGVHTANVRGSHLRRFRRRVAVIYQNHSLVASLNVLQNVVLGRLGTVRLPQSIRDALLPTVEVQHQVFELLDTLGIGDKLWTRVDELSGGQQQRVAVARALIQEPAVLLADEPVASVDHETATAILTLLSDLSRRNRTTVLISLHQTQYVHDYCDRAVELRLGRLMSDQRISASRAPTGAAEVLV